MTNVSWLAVSELSSVLLIKSGSNVSLRGVLVLRNDLSGMNGGSQIHETISRDAGCTHENTRTRHSNALR